MKPIKLFIFIAISCGLILCCTGVNNRIDLANSDIQFSRPRSSTKMIKGGKVAFELWIDKNKWAVYDSKDAGFMDIRNMQGGRGAGLSHVLKHNSGESMAIIQEISTPANFKTLHKALSESLSLGIGRIIDEEIRSVNGSEVMFIKWIEDLGTSKIVWLSYYLSNKTGHMRLAGGTTENLLAKYESDIAELLNGLVDSESPISATVVAEKEDIEKKLLQLKKLLKKGLITQADFDSKKAELLERF